MENMILLHNYHRDDDGPLSKVLFYTLFAATIMIFPYLIYKIIRLIRNQVRNYTIIYYYVNINFMLIGRAVYFSDAFVWHYNNFVIVFLATFPVVLLFTSG